MKSLLLAAVVFGCLVFPVLVMADDAADRTPPAQKDATHSSATDPAPSDNTTPENQENEPIPPEPTPVFAAPAQKEEPVNEASTVRTFDRLKRFAKPIDPIIEYRNAQNVVLLDVPLHELPEAIRNDLQQTFSACPNIISTGGIKAFSYVADTLRARGLSANYLIDFTKLVGKKSCAANETCGEDGCQLISYNSTGFNKWRKDQTLTIHSWALKQVDDQRANPLPQLKKPTILSVFEMTEKCKDQKATDDLCQSYHIWLSGGLNTYSPTSE